MAGVTTHPQEAMFQTATFQVVLEFPPDIPWQFRPLCGQLDHERRIVLLYQLVEQRLLWAMAFVTMTALAQAGFLASRPVCHDRFLAWRCFLSA
jgi:hypothetical protein